MIEALFGSVVATAFGVVILIALFRHFERRRVEREAAVSPRFDALAVGPLLAQFEVDVRTRIDAFKRYADELLASPQKLDGDDEEKMTQRLPGAARLVDLPRWARVTFAARVGRFLLTRFRSESEFDDELLTDLQSIASAAERAAALGRGGEVKSPSALLGLLGLPDSDESKDSAAAFFRVVRRVFDILAEAARGRAPNGGESVLLLATVGSHSARLSEDLRLLTQLAHELNWNDSSAVPTGLFPDFTEDRLLSVTNQQVGGSQISIPPELIPFPRAVAG